MFIKYWFLFALFVFAIILKFSLEEYAYQKGSHRFVAQLIGATSVISGTTLDNYLDPVAKSIQAKKYTKASTLLHLTDAEVKSMKGVFSKVNMIIAEKDVRYEFVIFVNFCDTLHLKSIENAFLNYIANNPMERRDYDTKKILYEKEQTVLDAELTRVDSTIALENTKKSVYLESLFASKADIKVKKALSDEKFHRYYDVQKILGFSDTMLVFETGTKFDWKTALKWFFGALFFEIVLIVAVDKKVQNKIQTMAK